MPVVCVAWASIRYGRAANQALVTFAVNCVGTNLVTFMSVVMRLDNANAANKASNWNGTTYVFSIVGAIVSDSYWGRYKACAIFQLIFLAVRRILLSVFLACIHSAVIHTPIWLLHA